MDGFALFAHKLPMDGYGYASIKIREALDRIGARVRYVDMCNNGKHTDFGERRWKTEHPALAICLPEWWPDISTPRLIGHTMFESTRMPEGRVEIINKHSTACVVPCEWCADMFYGQGVRAPIHVARWGIDPGDYAPMDRRDHAGRPYTFLWSGTPDRRKGWDLAYSAFYAAFGKRDDIRLVMHFRKLPIGLTGSSDENVKIVSGLISMEEWRALLQAADCFVFPSRGEGWGLPPREAAATGLPTIATDWGGMHEEISRWGLPLEVQGMRPAAFGGWDAGQVGLWSEPNFEHLVNWMRWCAEYRDEAAALGRRAAAFLETTTWERTAEKLLAVIGVTTTNLGRNEFGKEVVKSVCGV